MVSKLQPPQALVSGAALPQAAALLAVPAVPVAALARHPAVQHLAGQRDAKGNRHALLVQARMRRGMWHVMMLGNGTRHLVAGQWHEAPCCRHQHVLVLQQSMHGALTLRHPPQRFSLAPSSAALPHTAHSLREAAAGTTPAGLACPAGALPAAPLLLLPLVLPGMACMPPPPCAAPMPISGAAVGCLAATCAIASCTGPMLLAGT